MRGLIAPVLRCKQGANNLKSFTMQSKINKYIAAFFMLFALVFLSLLLFAPCTGYEGHVGFVACCILALVFLKF